jgi:hypothetical protein
MDSSIKPKPLIGEILPGFTFLILALYSYLIVHPCQFNWIVSNGATTIAASGLVFILAWIIGDFFDSLRETVVETIWDWFSEIYWNFFFEADSEKAEQLENYYYSYYELSINLAISIIIFLISEILSHFFNPALMKPFSWWINLIFIFIAVIFFWDAKILRDEIKDIIDKEKAKTK